MTIIGAIIAAGVIGFVLGFSACAAGVLAIMYWRDRLEQIQPDDFPKHRILPPAGQMGQTTPP